MELNKKLAEFAGELPGIVTAALVLVEEGLPIAEYNTVDSIEAGAAAAHLAGVVKSNLKALKRLDGGEEPEDILITTESHYYLIRPISGKPYFLFIMTKKDEWLGRTRMLMKEYAEVIDYLQI